MTERWQRIGRGLRTMGRLAVVLAAIGALAYWFWWRPTPVLQHRVQRGEIVAEVMGTGTLEARVKTAISPKISGRLAAVLVDQGDRVSQGQLLVQLDDVELAQQVAIARASEAAEQAAVQRLQTDKKRALAVDRQAQQHYDRTARLRQSDAVSESDLDRASEALAVARAGTDHAEAAVTEAEKELVEARMTLQYHQARLADCEIAAPFDGLIVARQRDPGEIVVPGGSILTLISTAQLWISAWVDETELAKLQPGQAARVVFRSQPERSYPGKVARLGRETDRETREFVVDVEVGELPENWAVGQRADVFIEFARQTSALLASSAMITWRESGSSPVEAPRQPGVFVNEEGVARWRPLRLGIQNRDASEVLAGLNEGDLIVQPVASRTRLVDGKRIISP